MSDFTVTIVGTGVVGTSLGLALKEMDDAPQIIAHDKELAHAQAGAKKGAFDRVEWNLVNACDQADLIVLALPLDGVRPTLEAIADYVKPGVVITDTCRSKESVLAWAAETLPDHAHFVGGNPVVGAAGSGHQNAQADLFRDRFYCLVSAPGANESAINLIIDMIKAVGARPLFIDAVEHDGLMTSVEHLPTALGVTLVSALAHQGAWREIRKVAGPKFEHATAGAAGTTDGVVEEMLANRQNLLRWLDTYLTQLTELRAMLAEEDQKEALIEWVDRALVERYNWQVDYEQRRFNDPLTEPARVEAPSFMKRLIGFRR